MTKTEARTFIKKNKEQIQLFAEQRNFGRLTRDEKKEYQEVYSFIEPKAHLCFTCGRSAQLMARRLLRYYEDTKPKRKSK